MKVIQPYKHDCENCKWVGWIPIKDQMGNMYICHKDPITEIIIRWSDEGSDYSCYSYHKNSTYNKPHPISIVGDDPPPNFVQGSSFHDLDDEDLKAIDFVRRNCGAPLP